MKRFIQEKQYDTLQRVFEELDEFENRLIVMECMYSIDDVKNWQELYKEIDFARFSDTLRELKYLVDVIDGQEVKENE